MDTEGLAPGFMASEMDPQKTVRFCINKSMLVVDHLYIYKQTMEFQCSLIVDQSPIVSYLFNG